MFKKTSVFTRPPQRAKRAFTEQGRSERRGEAYSVLYVEPLSDARTKLEDFFNILLDDLIRRRPPSQHRCNIVQADESHTDPRLQRG